MLVLRYGWFQMPLSRCWQIGNIRMVNKAGDNKYKWYFTIYLRLSVVEAVC